MKRIIFDNIVFKSNDFIEMMNLISFRRKIISVNEFEFLEKIYSKKLNNAALEESEEKLLSKFEQEKQILNKKDIISYDEKIKKYFFQNAPKVKAITFNITHKCNFRCSYCYQRHSYDRNIKLNVEDIEQIQNYVFNYLPSNGIENNLNYAFISGGEPLLEENVKAINKCLDLFGSEKVRFKMFTNGVNILKLVNFINFSKIKEYQISLDGTDEIIQKINKFPIKAFDEITKGIRYLAEMGGKINVPIMLVPEVLEKLPDLISELEKINLFNYENINFSLTTVLNHSENRIIDTSVYSLEEYLNIRKKARELIRGSRISLSPIPELSSLLKYTQRGKNVREIGLINNCSNYENIPLMFAPDKNVYWCGCETPKVGSVGQFGESPFINKSLLGQYMKRNIFSVPQCNDCILRYVCGGGCVLASTAQGNTVEAPFCGAFANSFVMDHLEEFLF